MRFPPYFLERLRAQITLSEVIGRHTPLKRHGREYQALCPFHKEKTPSFTVSNEKGFYHCFGCGAHGDAIKFVMETQGLRYPEAVERLAGEAGLAIPRMTAEEENKERRRLSLYEVLEQSCQWFERQLRAPAGREALDYLRGRGVQPETIAGFRLGYAPEGRDGLKRALLAQGVDERQMLDAGLTASRDGGETYDRFRARVIFPIADSGQRVIAFGGRTMSGDKNIPKYLNSPETELFHKGEVLYNFARARRAASESGEVIAGEGYMDVIAMAQAGIAHAVAPLGTAVTEPQLRLLWRMADAPVFCLDGDAAGTRAMERAAELAMPLLEPGKTLRFAFLPEGEDPDSLLRYRGRAAFGEALKRAPGLSEMLWETRSRRAGTETPEKKAALEHELMQLTARIKNPTVQAHFRSYFRERLWPRRDGKARAPAPSGRLLQGLARDPAGGGTLRRFEAQMLRLALALPELLGQAEVEEALARMQCGDARLDGLRGAILERWDRPASGGAAPLARQLAEEGFRPMLEALENECNVNAMMKLPAELSREEALAVWRALWDGYTLAQMQEECRRAEAELAAELSEENFSRLTELQRQMEQLRLSRTFSLAAEELEAM